METEIQSREDRLRERESELSDAMRDLLIDYEAREQQLAAELAELRRGDNYKLPEERSPTEPLQS